MTVLYRLFDAAGDLLYIGITGDVSQRLAQHRVKSPFGPNIAAVTSTEYPCRDVALLAEREAIREEEPRHNFEANSARRRAEQHKRRAQSRLTVDVAEAAVRLGVSKRQLYGLIERGEFPAIKLGRRRVVPIIALDELLENAAGERAAS